MKGLETGKDKIKKITDILRKETLEPAKSEAEQIVANAQKEAAAIIKEGRSQVEGMKEEARQQIEKERNIFQSSLNQACKQALEDLKQKIEDKMFNRELLRLILAQTQKTEVIAELIRATILALEKDGIGADLSIYIPAEVPARDVNSLIAKEFLEKLREKSVLLGDIGGGIEVKLHGENITVDISAKALKDIVAKYIRKDFREMVFQQV